jgi:signal transduction histidine kinase
MQQIILDLLDYSRVGRVDSEREEVNLNEILKIVKGLHKRVIEKKRQPLHGMRCL